MYCDPYLWMKRARIPFSSLGRMSGATVVLRMLDFFSIPRAHGGCVVLLLAHPGLNLLSRHFPPSKVNALLLADVSRAPPPQFSHDDVFMMGTSEPYETEEKELYDLIDLASFLE
jgi:hypothetical protein